MTKSVFDLHLNCVEYASNRIQRINHCKMVAWLANNFRKIKVGEVTYENYETETHCLGTTTFKKESFEMFKAQPYV